MKREVGILLCIRRVHRVCAIAVLGASLLPGSVIVSPQLSGATGFTATARQLAGAPLNPLAAPDALVRLGARVFILDANAVESWNVATQAFAVVAGSRADAGSRDGVGVSARFDAPQGIATDGTDLYVADTGNDTIRKVVVATGVVSTLAGHADRPGARDGIGAAARFDQPSGLAVEGGNLWIADRANFTVRALHFATGEVTTPAGAAGQSAHLDGVGSAARFTDPRAMAADAGALWITDGSLVRRLDAATTRVDTRASLRRPGLRVTPTGVDAGAGVVYVALFVDDRDDTTGTEIVAVSESTGAVASVPMPSYRDATAVAVDRYGTKLTVVGHGAFYPSLYSTALASGVSHDLAPFNERGFVDGNAATARFDFPSGVAVSGHTLFVVDEGNHAIRTVDADTGAVTTLAHDVGFSLSGAALAGGALYVADNTAIRRVDTATGTVESFATLPSRVNDLTVAGSDLYAVANDCAMYRVPLATGTPTVFAGAAGSCGSTDGTGSSARFGADATCPACPPLGIATDGVDLYVADHLSVRKVEIATTVVSTIVPAGPPYDPQLDIAVADGQVYVVRILSVVRVAAKGGHLFQVTATGDLVDHLGSTPTRASQTSVQPSGIAADVGGHRLFFTDQTGVGVIQDP